MAEMDDQEMREHDQSILVGHFEGCVPDGVVRHMCFLLGDVGMYLSFGQSNQIWDRGKSFLISLPEDGRQWSGEGSHKVWDPGGL